MSGNLAMGSNKVTGLAAPTDANDATSKTYVDGILVQPLPPVQVPLQQLHLKAMQQQVKLMQVTQLVLQLPVKLMPLHHMITLMTVTLELSLQHLQ
jgi:hypothetical protein